MARASKGESLRHAALDRLYAALRRTGFFVPRRVDEVQPAEESLGSDDPGDAWRRRRLEISLAAHRGRRDVAAHDLQRPALAPAGPVRRGRWSQAELDRLREVYGLKDDRSIARELRRPLAGVRRMAEQVFGGRSRTGPWTADEMLRLKRYLGASTSETIALVLGRPVDEVEERILELGRIRRSGRWSRGELSELKRLYGTRTDDDLAKVFGRSVESVRAMAADLALAKDKAFLRRVGRRGPTRMPRWTTEELATLERHYPTMPNLEIAQRLQRSVKSVISKAHSLGLRKDTERLREMGRENVRLRYQE